MIGAERFQIIVALVPLLLLTLGAMHLHDCPKEPMVPIYVIVGSTFFLFVQLVGLCGCIELCVIPVLLILIFLFIWLITGSVFVYRAFKPDFESRRSPEYCEKILYEAAFWCTNLAWVSITLSLTAALCRLLYRCIYEREEKDDTEAGRSSPKEEEEEESAPLSDKIEQSPQTTPQNPQPETREESAPLSVKIEQSPQTTPQNPQPETREESAPLSGKIEQSPQTTPQNPQPEITNLNPDMATVDSEAKI